MCWEPAEPWGKVSVYSVLYILSAGHSGSTLLDLLAGSIPGLFSTGEVVHLPWQVYRDGNMCPLHEDLCTCGATFKKCPVWGPVLDRVGARMNMNLKDRPLQFKTHILATPAYRLPVKLPYQLVREVYFAGRFAGMDRILRATQYARTRNSWAVFDALGEVTGASVIVDSSKDVIRYEALRAARPARIRPVVLIRDARGVIGSAAKRRDPRAVERSLAGWDKVNRRILAAVRRDQPLIVRYTDLASNPAAMRHKIAAACHVEAGPFENRILPSERHLVAGNPMRYAQEIIIRPDEGWRERLTPEQRAAAEAANARLDRRLRSVALGEGIRL